VRHDVAAHEGRTGRLIRDARRDHVPRDVHPERLRLRRRRRGHPGDHRRRRLLGVPAAAIQGEVTMTRILRNTFLIVLAVLWLVPVYLMIVNAITPVGNYEGEPRWLPNGFGLWENIVSAWEQSALGLGL